MKLSKLLEYESIVVQCHDNPDADALACGMALLAYLKEHDKNACFIYSGRYMIQKSNLLLMIKDLGIDINYADAQSDINRLLHLPADMIPELLVTVDCQYGEGNVRKFNASKIAIIDHHQLASKPTRMMEIRSEQASCSTVIWDMMKKAGFNVNRRPKIATALYYGLMTDSGNFTEINHPLDRDMRDELKFNHASITKYKNSNISQNELKIAGLALLGYEYYKKNRYAIVRTEPCDPNVLGIISDMLLEVDSVDSCLVYNISEAGVKISVRSCTVETKANELADFLADTYGGGGGNVVKAGGFLQRKLLEKNGVVFEEDSIHDFFRDMLQKYFEETDVIYAGKTMMDTDGMQLYRKKKIPLGYIVGGEVVPVGSKAIIRTLQGDIEIEIKRDTIIMVGVDGELYPVNERHFIENNVPVDRMFKYPGDYIPTIKNTENGRSYEIQQYIKACVSKGESMIYARPLERRVKVFTNWGMDRYSLGKEGDYLAIGENNPNNIYIIEKDVFPKIYEKV